MGLFNAKKVNTSDIGSVAKDVFSKPITKPTHRKIEKIKPAMTKQPTHINKGDGYTHFDGDDCTSQSDAQQHTEPTKDDELKAGANQTYDTTQPSIDNASQAFCQDLPNDAEEHFWCWRQNPHSIPIYYRYCSICDRIDCSEDITSAVIEGKIEEIKNLHDYFYDKRYKDNYISKRIAELQANQKEGSKMTKKYPFYTPIFGIKIESAAQGIVYIIWCLITMAGLLWLLGKVS